MYLLIYEDATVRVVTDLQEAIDHLDESPLHQAYGFMGWQIELEDETEEEVPDEPAQPEE